MPYGFVVSRLKYLMSKVNLLSSTNIYDNCSLGPKLYFEISIVSSYPYFEISIVSSYPYFEVSIVSSYPYFKIYIVLSYQYFEISIVSTYPYFEIPVVEIPQLQRLMQQSFETPAPTGPRIAWI